MTCVAMQFKSTRALKSMLANSNLSRVEKGRGYGGMFPWKIVKKQNS